MHTMMHTKSSYPYIITNSDILHKLGEQKKDGELREYVLRIADMPVDVRPREKLIKYGPTVLSVVELLAVLLGTGTKKEEVMEMAGRIIREYGERSIIAEDNPTKLSEDLALPIGKACQIIACGELGRRFYQKNNSGFTVIRSAQDVYEHLRDMQNLPKEHLRGLYLNAHNRIIHDEVISIGTINASLIHPREVFRPAIEYGAVAVVLAHNHPSGTPTPSEQDIDITKQLIQAGKIVGINVLDHVIITKDTFMSVSANY